MPGLNPGITVFEPSPSNIVGVHGLEREHPARSKMLTYAGAVTSGVLTALALQIYLSGAGFDLGALWNNLLSAKPRELRTTGPWWAIAGMAFVVSGATAAALVRLPFPWRRFRPLRWVLGALIVLLLAPRARERRPFRLTVSGREPICATPEIGWRGRSAIVALRAH